MGKRLIKDRPPELSVTSAVRSFDRLELLRLMFLSREMDRREGILLRQGMGWFQVASAGHEALAVISGLLRKDDFIFPHYRDRCLLLGRGVPPIEFARMYFGKRMGESGGRQMAGHFSWRDLNVWSMPSPVGSNLLPAAGAAWGMKLSDSDSLALACLGDGATRQGEFYEALTFAQERKLPVVFLLEDNHYSISTNTEGQNPFTLKVLDMEIVTRVDGRDPESVYSASLDAMNKARAGDGPTVLWCDIDRLGSHTSSDDQRLYVDEESITTMHQRDPIDTLAEILVQEGVLTDQGWQDAQEEIRQRVSQCYAQAADEPDPEPEDADIHRLGVEPSPPTSLPLPPGEWHMADAVNTVFHEGLRNNKEFVFFGENIADPTGGVFKLTLGLCEANPDNVFNSPLAEATIAGVACGLACFGRRPVFEMQFVDFIAPAWNQLVQNMANIRWRSMGKWICPAVIYAPYGAYLPAGALWHSQSNEAALAHFPGIRIVVPSTPEDAAGLLWTAMHANDPTVVLLPKHLFWAKSLKPSRIEAVPFGRAALRREGSRLTLVAWGNGVELGIAAASQLEEQISVEVLDLRSIKPWDREAVVQSVEKTGHLVVVQEDTAFCSVGQMIISSLMEDPHVWARLERPPVLITRGDVNIGFNPVYEYGTLPTVDKVVATIRRSMQIEADPTQQDPMSDRVGVGDAASVVSLYVPPMGEGLREVLMIDTLKEPGETIAKDEPIYRVETEKAVSDIESPYDGVLVEWMADSGDTMAIGSVVASVRVEGAVPMRLPTATHKRPQASAKVVPESSGSESIVLSPRQRRLAHNMRQGQQKIVPATAMIVAGWDRLDEVASSFRNRRSGVIATPFLLMARCVALAMRNHPKFRSTWSGDNIRTHKKINLGIARSLPNDELVTAVVAGADELEWIDFLREARRQIKRAGAGEDGTSDEVPLVITAMGGYGLRSAVPVATPPVAATLFVGDVYEQAVRDGTEVVFRREVTLSLTFDHCMTNGAAAASFLNEIRHCMGTAELPD